MTVTIENANTYFSTNLNNDTWMELTTAQKTQALTMAENHVLCYLGVDEVDEENQNMLSAIYEQSIFLIQNVSGLVSDKDVISETIQGVGSRTYRHMSVGSSRFGTMAMMFLRRITGGRLSRG